LEGVSKASHTVIASEAKQLVYLAAGNPSACNSGYLMNRLPRFARNDGF
jgi:hypothetical protein